MSVRVLSMTLLLMLVGGMTRVQAAPQPLRPMWGNLDGQWLFRTDPSDEGENQGWQNTATDDSGWRSLHAPGYWEPQGITDPRPGQQPRPKNGMPWTDYDGAAWYRLHVFVPAEWKGQPLVLALGSVDDEDRTFFNGHLVGSIGSEHTMSVSASRNYPIDPQLVQYGKLNLIAVRVYDGGGPGGLMGPMLSLIPKRVAEGTTMLAQSDRPVAARFSDPPADCRILKIIHSWPDTEADQLSLIRQLLAQGFGGVVCNDSFTNYLTDEARWQAFERAVKAAKKVGMAMWLYDEKGYPSGTAGGLTMRDHPEYEADGLLIIDQVVDGGDVSLDVPPGSLHAASAYPVVDGVVDLAKPRDLRGAVQHGKLVCALPAGRWRVLVITEDHLYEGAHASMSLGDKLHYINLLEHDPTAQFIQETHQRYAAHLGSNLGVYFKSTFTDEPSLMSHFIKPMPYRVLPWGPNIEKVFRESRGYELAPVLPYVIMDAGAQSSKARYDFWQTVGDMVSENYFGQLQTWCRAHGFASGGHLLMEESLLSHVSLYGNFMQCARRLDSPSIDCLTSLPGDVPWYIARLISSVADLQGRSLTMCETSDFGQVYRPNGDTRPVVPVSEAEVRGTCNRLMLNGINTITSYYTFNGLSADQLQRLNNWVGRCCTMLRGGKQVTDIGLVYPIESVWPRFRPASSGATDSASATQVESAYRLAAESLYGARRDFTYIDSRTLVEGKVKDGVFSCSGMRWRVIVLPCVDTLPMKAWTNLAEFVQTGGVVVAMTTLPRNSATAFPDPKVVNYAKAIFGEGFKPRVHANSKGGAGIFLPTGSESLLSVALNGVLAHDVAISDVAAPIRVTHRRIDGSDVYFLINDSGKAWKGSANVCVSGPGELWDPATGLARKLTSGRNVALSLPDYGGVILRFKTAALPARKKIKSGTLPGITTQPIATVQPVVGAGEFVKPTINPASNGIHAVGTLTKSGVDTFLFLSYHYNPTLNLSKSDGLSITISTPAGQTAATQFLVIAVCGDGAQYLANTGRSLALPGRTELVIPWSSFQLAGWSKVTNSKFAPDSITGINVGWGGYFGQQGETVDFTVQAIKAVVLPK